MHLIHKDLKQGLVTIKVTDPEDLWYLSTIIEPHDIITGKTTRKIKIGDSENAKVIKKTYTLKIEAEKIEFNSTAQALRINGKVIIPLEDIPKGSYHTISVEVNEEFTLEKKQWLEYQLQKLEEATEKRYNYLLCLFDREEVLFALTKKSSYEILLTLKGDVPKKSHSVEIKKDFQEEIIALLRTYNTRFSPEKIILASPAFYKEDLNKKITDTEIKKKIILATCSDVTESNLPEVIASPELNSALQSSRSREEQIIIDELLKEISKDGAAAYGYEEVKQTILTGSIKTLLLTDTFIQQARNAENYDELDKLIKQVYSMQGKIYIFSQEQESGKKLHGLGGIAALLKYKVWK